MAIGAEGKEGGETVGAAGGGAIVIDGKAIASDIHAEIQREVSYLWNNYGRVSNPLSLSFSQSNPSFLLPFLVESNSSSSFLISLLRSSSCVIPLQASPFTRFISNPVIYNTALHCTTIDFI